MYVYTIIFFTFLFQIALKGSIILTSLYALHLQASPVTLGIIMAVGSLFPMLFASTAGKLADRIAINKLLTIGMIGSGISLWCVWLFEESLYILFVVQLVFGLFQILTVVCSQSAIGTISTPELRTKHFSTYTLGVSLANLIGPMIVGVTIDVLSYQAAFFLLGIFAFVPAIAFLFIKINDLQVPKTVDTIRLRTREILKKKELRFALVTSGIILTGVGLFEFYFPIYTDYIGISPSIIGFLVSLNGLAYIISRLVMVPLQKYFSPGQIIGACLMVTAFAFFILPFNSTIISLALLSFVIGLGLGCCQPLSIVMTYAVSPARHTGEVLGLRLTVNKAVQFTVPLLFGSISFLGVLPIFWLNGMLLLFSGGTLLKKYKKSVGA